MEMLLTGEPIDAQRAYEMGLINRVVSPEALDAVRAGLFRPLGEGAARIKDVLAHLRGAGYAGWYVLEQDVMLDSDPAPGPPGWIAQSAAFARKNA